MPIETQVPYSDGWWLQQLYAKLRKQQKHAEDMHVRFKGDPPMPPMSPNQADAVKWFVKKARTNFERLIVNAVLNRLEIRGIRTAVDEDEGGDAEAFRIWKRSRGKLWSTEVHKYALSMGIGFGMVGRDERTDRLLVTAEDPRHCVVITDPADPFRVLAALKLVYDPVGNQDVAFLFVLEEDSDGGHDRMKMRKAIRNRAVSTPVAGWIFDANAFDWIPLIDFADGDSSDTFYPSWLQGDDERDAMCPIVPFENEDGMAEFEPHLELLDRITQQILQRMTVVTIQAFKQRAMKGLPQTDPKTGEKIDYDKIFIAEPGAIWNIPAAVEIWESGEADIQGILLSVRDDIKDLAAVSGTPLYTVTPDVANGSAEGASLQREQLTFKVKHRQTTWELSHERMCELIFRTAPEDDDAAVTERNQRRSEPGATEIMWVPVGAESMSERANAIAQTKGVIPVYLQYTEIWGWDPATADRALTMLTEDMARQQAMAPQPAQPTPQPPQTPAGGPQRPRAVPEQGRAAQPRERAPAPKPAA